MMSNYLTRLFLYNTCSKKILIKYQRKYVHGLGLIVFVNLYVATVEPVAFR